MPVHSKVLSSHVVWIPGIWDAMRWDLVRIATPPWLDEDNGGEVRWYMLGLQ